jgi:hypothetical protein
VLHAEENRRQTITVRASGQIALDLHALSRGATICATLRDLPGDHQVIAFSFPPV